MVAAGGRGSMPPSGVSSAGELAGETTLPFVCDKFRCSFGSEVVLAAYFGILFEDDEAEFSSP